MHDSQRNNYDLVDEQLQSAPCIPDEYADIGSHQEHNELFQLQRRSKRDVVRGLTCGSNQPFLSLLLWNDWDWKQAALLISTFNSNGHSNMTLTVWSGDSIWTNKQHLHLGCSARPDHLNALFLSRCIAFSDLGGASTWTLGRRWNSAYRRNKCIVWTHAFAFVTVTIHSILFFVVIVYMLKIL